ncbi:MAG TPA: ATP-dependent Clp protease proteolytic subunit [Verrucomicrobiae bacterium]|nr:ATP-dependent Clp protease proteolytic subunit [Verrucomicrobiae bacterium]
MRSGTGRPSTGRLTSPAQERRVIMRGRLTKLIASCCIARLVVLAAEDQLEPIIVYIDSPGGSLSEAMGVLSTMNGVRCPVLTFCRGQVAGPAAIIAAHGLTGYRVAAPGARFSLKFSGGAGQEESDVESLLPLLTEALSKDTRRTREEVLEWFRSGAEFGAQEAIRRGFIDTIAEQPVIPKPA